MGQIYRSVGPSDFSKAVISFWFKISAAQIAAAQAAWVPAASSFRHYGDFPQFNGMIPLITFGNTGTQRDYIQNFPFGSNYSYDLRFWNGSAWVSEGGYPFSAELDLHQYAASGPVVDTEPSFIGLLCVNGMAFLMINLQLAANASIVQYAYSSTSDTGTSYVGYNTGIGSPPPPPPSTWTETIAFRDDSSVYMSATECFQSITPPTDPSQFSNYDGSFGMPVSPNVWHHVLVSFNLTDILTKGYKEDVSGITGSPSVTNFSKMWVALDDVNQTGVQLFDKWGGFSPPDPNAIIPNQAYAMLLSGPIGVVFNGGSNVDGNHVTNDTVTNVDSAQPSFTYSSPVIPASGFNIGIPADPRFTANIYSVNMAELQMFTGVTLDTSVTGNRRAFVSSSGTPVPVPAGQTFLGVSPVAAFVKKSTNWIAGIDTGGTLGNFTPAGTISTYTIDPKFGS